MCHAPTQIQGPVNLKGLQGLRGWVHMSALAGSSRAGVQVLCVTPPKPQGAVELRERGFPHPKLNGPTGWLQVPARPTPPWVGVCVRPLPAPADPAAPAPGAEPSPGVPGTPPEELPRGRGRLQEASL